MIYVIEFQNAYSGVTEAWVARDKNDFCSQVEKTLWLRGGDEIEYGNRDFYDVCVEELREHTDEGGKVYIFEDEDELDKKYEDTYYAENGDDQHAIDLHNALNKIRNGPSPITGR